MEERNSKVKDTTRNNQHKKKNADQYKKQKMPWVEVSVYDDKGNFLPLAKVTLKSLETPDRILDIKFNKKLQVYRKSRVNPGRYKISVEAKKYMTDSHEIAIDFSGLKSIFILGKKGMLFYYRGKVKIPFRPQRNILGLSLKSVLSNKQEEELASYARKLKLRSVRVSNAVRDEGIRIFRFIASISKGDKQKIQQQLSEHPMVRLVGPVVRFDELNVSFLTNELIVKFKAHIPKEEVPSIVKEFKLNIIRTFPYAGNSYLLRADTDASYDLLKIFSEIAESDLVEYAEPNLVVSAVDLQINPTDFLYSQQWHIPLINLPNAWQTLRNANPVGVNLGDPGDSTFGSENVIIAVMDKGIQSQTMGGVTTSAHADFDENITNGDYKVYRFYDFKNMVSNNDNPPNDHGMGCAGVATALANNPSVISGEEEGVAGAAPNCKVMGLIRPWGESDVRYADAYIWMAGFDPGWVADGINYPLGTVFPSLISPGADIISNSFIIPSSSLMEDCFDFLVTYGRGGKGIPIFCAAGNSNINVTLNNPMAAYRKAIAIAASTNNDVKSSYSAWGNDIDLCAPSSDSIGITTCDLIGGGNLAGHTGGGLDYRDNFGGTSSATPLVAGVAALMLSVNPHLTWVELLQILCESAVQIDVGNTDSVGQWVDTDGDGVLDFSQWYGHGRVDAEAAVISARDYSYDRDIVVRDNLNDNGSVPSGTPFWNSPDIWVRNTDPTIDGAAALPATYMDHPPHQKPVSSQDNWIYIRFKNVGSDLSYDFYIRIYITHFPGSEFRYPEDFIPTNSSNNPFPTPLVPATYLIGEIHNPSVPSGTDDIINLKWPKELSPPETVSVGGVPVKWHPCLLVEISPHDGPLPTGPYVWDNNNLAQKNISIDYPDAGDTFDTAMIVGNRANQSPYIELLIDRSYVPPQVKLYVELMNNKAKESLKKFVKEGKFEEAAGCFSLELFEKACLLIDCNKIQRNSKFLLTLPAGIKLEMKGQTIYSKTPRYNFTLGKYGGRDVIWLSSHEKTRIPIFTNDDPLIPIIIGGVVGENVKSGGYEIRVEQINSNGQISGGYGIELNIRNRRKSKLDVH